jgi:hypothetical protein
MLSSIKCDAIFSDTIKLDSDNILYEPYVFNTFLRIDSLTVFLSYSIVFLISSALELSFNNLIKTGENAANYLSESSIFISESLDLRLLISFSNF